MNKEQFLSAVRERLSGLPEEDIQRSLDYYAEMIDDRMEDGMGEEAAVAAMGTVEEAAAQILLDTPLPKLVKARVKPEGRLRVWEILLLVLGSPLWLPLVLLVALFILLVYLLVWTFVLIVYAVNLSLAAWALSGLVGGAALLFQAGAIQALFVIGCSLICAGLAILLFFGCVALTKAVVQFSKLIGRWVKSWFIEKGEKT